jgi:hypothetical protein
METHGGREQDEGPEDGEERPQDEFVERLRPDPSQPPQRILTLAGLLGDSDRAGFRRLYFTRELDYYAEFRSEDVLDTAPVPPDQPPFLGDEATRVTIKRGATIEYTRARAARPRDEFDLDVRLGGGPAWAFAVPETFAATCSPTCGPGCILTQTCRCPTVTCRCPTSTCVCPPTGVPDTCAGRTCVGATCWDTCGRTCETCRTLCGQQTCDCPTQGQATCWTCGEATCQTCPGQATCQTCAGQATCVTCRTCGGQATCDPTCPRTCDTCNPHICGWS